jgi:predicted amidohydrolase
MPDTLTVGLAQSYPKLGDVEANLEHHISLVEKAAEQQVELLVFPELSLTGYLLQDMTYRVAMSADSDTLEPLREATRQQQMDVMYGFVDVDQRGRFYIAAAYCSRGDILHVHHKVYLPTYGLFDEGRFFAEGDDIRAFDTPFGRVGVLICEDFWHVSPAYALWMDGADILIFHSASPGRGIDERETLNSTRWVELVNQAYGSLFTNYVIHCNRVGYEGGYNFWGGSTVVDPNGEFLVRGPYFDEAMVVQTLDLNQIRRTRSRLPLLRDERMDLIQKSLNRIADED